MANPITSQTKKRTHVSTGSDIISTRHVTIDRPGRYGDPGTRNPRGRSGCLRRSTITPAETTMKANSVPIFARSANQSISKTPHISTWIAGLVVRIPAGVFDIDWFADLANIGTLFAFIVVSAGVIDRKSEENTSE